MEKYVGRTVEIVYVDREGRLSQRLIRVGRVSGSLTHAHCLTTCKPRTFRSEQILAVQPVYRRVG